MGGYDTHAAQDAAHPALLTTAVEQNAATMARWMGVSASNLPLVLPNLPNFAPATLGFMS